MEQNGLEVLVNCIEFELADVSGGAAESSSQFLLTVGNGTRGRASRFTSEMPVNDEGISQSGSQCIDSLNHTNHGVGYPPQVRRHASNSEMSIRFAPITLDKNLSIIDNEPSDVDGLEEGRTNERTRHENKPKVVVIEGKPTRQQKQTAPKPMSTSQNSLVEAKYVRKERKNLPEALTECNVEVQHGPSDGKYVQSMDADHGSKFEVVTQHKQSDDSTSQVKSVVTGSKREEVTQHKQNNDCNLQIKNVDIGSAQEVAKRNRASNGSTVQTPPPNASGDSEGGAGLSARIASGIGHPVRQVVEEFKSRGFFNRRQCILGENLKAPDWPTRGTAKNKRSAIYTKRRSFGMWSKFIELRYGGLYVGEYIWLPPFVPEQCKKTRTKAAASEHAPIVAPNVPLPPIRRSSIKQDARRSGKLVGLKWVKTSSN